MNLQGVVAILDKSIGGPDADIGAHGTFWRGVIRDEFVKLKVFGRPLLVVGDGAHSNLVLALKGEVPFGSDLEGAPDDAIFPRMPAGLDAVPLESIRDIEQWIDAGCPEDADIGSTETSKRLP
jgi:hypothetical protein